MGLGLEMWDLRVWFAYVLAMILLEAWLIGRWLEMAWPESLARSLVANAFTGFMCGGAGLVAPFLHMSFVGSKLDPNPLLNSVALLLIFAVPSGIFEAIVWGLRTDSKKAYFGRCLLVHVLTVPVGLAILLIPPKPYLGLEAITEGARRIQCHDLIGVVGSYVADKGHLPNSMTPTAFIAELKPYIAKAKADMAKTAPYVGDLEQDLELTLYEPRFDRFATGEDHEHPWEFNPAVAGKKIDESQPSKSVWLTRSPNGKFGIVVDLSTGAVTYSHDSKELAAVP